MNLVGGRAAPRPPLVLWSVPRSGSTAFERMMRERGDHRVLSEPFSASYYDGPEQRSARFPVTDPTATPERIAEAVVAEARSGPVFVKDMAYHVAPVADAAFLTRFSNSFLIRDPAWSIPSLAARWADFTDEEAGFQAVARLVGVLEADGREPVIVDNDDLRCNPAGIVEAWCRAVAIPHLPEALTWDPGRSEGWDRWADWHEATASSSGFRPLSGAPPPRVTDPRLHDAVSACSDIYAALRDRRLRPG